VQTCQHLGVDLNAYLEHALTALARGDANIDEFLPDRWQAANM
jgi:predicted hydrolase (HD superfamily)